MCLLFRSTLLFTPTYRNAANLFTFTCLALSLVATASRREFVDCNCTSSSLQFTSLFSLKIHSQREASGNRMSSTASTHR